MRWIAATLFLAAAATIAGTAWLYAPRAPFPAMGPADWAAFGTYFGGVAGPLLVFLTVVGLVLTLLMQNRQLEQVAEANIKDLHVRMLLEIGRDLDAIEAQHLTPGLTLGAVLSGAVPLPPAAHAAFGKALQGYTKVFGYYTQGVALYRDNVTPWFDCRAFEQRGLRLLGRIEPYSAHLGQMGGPSLALMRGELEGTLRGKE